MKFDFEKVNWSFSWLNEEKDVKGSITVPNVPAELKNLYERLQYFLCVELYDFPTQQDARLCSFTMNQKQIQATFCLTINKKVGEYAPPPFMYDFMSEAELDVTSEIRAAWDELVEYFIDNMDTILMVKSLQTSLGF